MPDGPGGFKQGSTCPALLRSHWKEDCIFTYAAVTLYGRPFQTVRLTLSYPSFNQAILPFVTEGPLDYCGPATPSSPFESPGLDFSAFARHYLRNHCCFLFLRVLRWFTSPSSLVYPMDSDIRSECSHSLGFPIRKSPDHSLVAASRGLSQLHASFIAFLRQGIHTHALSSLTIKSTSHTTGDWTPPSPRFTGTSRTTSHLVDATFFALTYLCFGNRPPLNPNCLGDNRDHLPLFVCPSNIQLSKIDLS